MDGALKQHDVFSASAPTFGGSSFWVRLPDGVSSLELEELSAKNGIVINSGDNYFASLDGPGNYCRLGFSSIPADDIVAGIDRLADLVRRLASRSSSIPAP